MDGHVASWYAHYLLSTETLLVTAAAVGTGIALFSHRWRPVLLLSTFPLVYGAFVASQAVRNNRTIMLLLPNLAVIAGLGGAALVEHVAPKGLGVRSLPVAAAALVAGLAVLGAQAARVVDSVGLPTTTTTGPVEGVDTGQHPAG